MSKLVKRVQLLIPSLPHKDIPLGFKFLENRDFDSLIELIDSAIYKIRRNQRSETPKEEYVNIDLVELSKLKCEVDTYVSMLELMNNKILPTQEECQIEENYY